jgi:hypothetical protein
MNNYLHCLLFILVEVCIIGGSCCSLVSFFISVHLENGLSDGGCSLSPPQLLF